MPHSEAVANAQRHLAQLGLPPSTFAPPLWKLLWRLGINIPPPLFMSFWHCVLFMGSFFGCFWGLLMWVIMWSRQEMPVALALASAAMAGVLFGLTVALYLRRLARRHTLPSWSTLLESQSNRVI